MNRTNLTILLTDPLQTGLGWPDPERNNIPLHTWGVRDWNDGTKSYGRVESSVGNVIGRIWVFYTKQDLPPEVQAKLFLLDLQ